MNPKGSASELLDNEAIVQISKAQQALDRAKDIYDMRAIGGMMEATALFAEKAGLAEVAQQAKILQLKAERKAGDWLAENVDRGNPQFVDDYQGLPEGVDKKESYKLQLEAALPEERFVEWIDESLAKGYEISAGGLRKIAANYLNKYEPPASTWERQRDTFRTRLVSSLDIIDMPPQIRELVNKIVSYLEAQ